MRLLWGLLVLCFLVWASAEDGEPFPVEFSGTWVGAVGRLRSIVLHSGGRNGSTVGLATYAGDGSSHIYFLLEYAPEDSQGGAVGLRGDRFIHKYGTWSERFFLVQTFGNKLLVDAWADEEKTSYVLIREDDGTSAKGGCNPTPAQKLEATLEKGDCEKKKRG